MSYGLADSTTMAKSRPASGNCQRIWGPVATLPQVEGTSPILMSRPLHLRKGSRRRRGMACPRLPTSGCNIPLGIAKAKEGGNLENQPDHGDLPPSSASLLIIPRCPSRNSAEQPGPEEETDPRHEGAEPRASPRCPSAKACRERYLVSSSGTIRTRAAVAVLSSHEDFQRLRVKPTGVLLGSSVKATESWISVLPKSFSTLGGASMEGQERQN